MAASPSTYRREGIRLTVQTVKSAARLIERGQVSGYGAEFAETDAPGQPCASPTPPAPGTCAFAKAGAAARAYEAVDWADLVV